MQRRSRHLEAVSLRFSRIVTALQAASFPCPAIPFGSGWTIDDSGNIYGEAQGGYAQFRPYLPPPDDVFLPTVWGAFYSGFSFGGGGILGDQSLLLNPNNSYSVQGHSYYVNKVRNGVTMASGFVGSTRRSFINNFPVDFAPITLNSQGWVLMSVPEASLDKVCVYDPTTASQTYIDAQLPHFAFQLAGRPPRIL